MIVIAGRPQQVMHAGGDDHQPPCGASLLYISCISLALTSKNPILWVNIGNFNAINSFTVLQEVNNIT